MRVVLFKLINKISGWYWSEYANQIKHTFAECGEDVQIGRGGILW